MILRGGRAAGGRRMRQSRQYRRPSRCAPFHQVDLEGLPAPRRRAAFDRGCRGSPGRLRPGGRTADPPLPLPRRRRGAGTALLGYPPFGGGRGLLARAGRRPGGGVPPGRARAPPHLAAQDHLVSGVGPPPRRGMPARRRWLASWSYWRETARVPVPRLPVDFPIGGNLGDLGNLAGDEATVSFELTAEETADLLQTLPSTYHSRIDDALLSSLVRALAGWTGSPRLRVDLEGHGREPSWDRHRCLAHRGLVHLPVPGRPGGGRRRSRRRPGERQGAPARRARARHRLRSVALSRQRRGSPLRGSGSGGRDPVQLSGPAGPGRRRLGGALSFPHLPSRHRPQPEPARQPHPPPGFRRHRGRGPAADSA